MIIDKINAATAEGRTYFSFEFFPPRTDDGVENLYERLDRMVAFQPTFCDITWGAGGSTAGLTLDISKHMQNFAGVETMMHLTCTNITREKIAEALETTKANGIQNILALRGDPPKGQETFTAVEGGFACALDLVKYIRATYGDSFGLAVAGYPEAHPDTIVEDPVQMKVNYGANLRYLKAKVDAGGDFVITQLFYDVDTFLQFVADCRAEGITCPIVPGIMPIMTFAGFKRMTGFCKTRVPQRILDELEPIKDNDEAVRGYGIDLGVRMCQQLLGAGIKGVHLYSLNLEKSALSILEKLGLIDTSNVPRALPWRPAATSKRSTEAVRPIFWANRPKAYLSRTSDWDSFPNGRWGDARSPAFGTLADYPFMRPHGPEKLKAKRAAWGEALSGLGDIQAVFAQFCRGEVKSLPWSEGVSNGLAPESNAIVAQLVALNTAGYLTINSQPAMNARPSADPVVGWGGAGGLVYQKAYLEFFCPPAKLAALVAGASKRPGLTFQAVNAAGDLQGVGPGAATATSPGSVNAVTWGVFPGREIVQPTVVDPVSFNVWKDEAFDLWLGDWGTLYEEGSPSQVLLASIKDTYWLVNIVDNDFTAAGKDLWTLMGLA